MSISNIDSATRNIDLNSRPVNVKTEDNIETQSTKIEQDLQKVDVNHLSEQEKNLMPVSEKAIIEAIEKANKIMINNNTRAEFAVHEVTKDIMVKIIDTEKNQVIREFPPKKILDMVAKMWEMAGLFVDERR